MICNAAEKGWGSVSHRQNFLVSTNTQNIRYSYYSGSCARSEHFPVIIFIILYILHWNSCKSLSHLSAHSSNLYCMCLSILPDLKTSVNIFMSNTEWKTALGIFMNSILRNLCSLLCPCAEFRQTCGIFWELVNFINFVATFSWH